jgi:hypothetical protein
MHAADRTFAVGTSPQRRIHFSFRFWRLLLPRAKVNTHAVFARDGNFLERFLLLRCLLPLLSVLITTDGGEVALKNLRRDVIRK